MYSTDFTREQAVAPNFIRHLFNKIIIVINTSHLELLIKITHKGDCVKSLKILRLQRKRGRHSSLWVRTLII